MDARFRRFFEDILKHEGGYMNHPADKGGETKYGISKRVYPHLDIKNLTKEEAMRIYYNDYWIKSGAEEIAKHSFQVATKYCDIAINMGIGIAKTFLRATLRLLGVSSENLIEGVKVAIQNSMKDAIIQMLMQEQKQRYLYIVAKDPKQEVFLKGWMKRASYEGVKEWG